MSSNLRKKTERLYEEYRAIYILSNGLDAHGHKFMESSLKEISELSQKALQTRYPQIRKALGELKMWIGAKGSLSKYEVILVHALKEPGKITWIPKWVIQEDLFDHYERAWPLFSELPPHGRIGIDVTGITKGSRQELIWTILEAQLFEDVALLWNSTCDAKAEKENHDTKETTKKELALVRSTVRSIFCFIEGYINALAWDILKVEVNNLNDDERGFLGEWDIKTNRPRMLSLRDKLIKYPKIALRAKHPILQESNCSELKLIAEAEEIWRHPLIHPKVETHQEAQDELAMRETVFFNLTFVECEKLLDASVSLIKKISNQIGRKYGTVNIWICDRNHDDGRFPASVFD